MRFLATAVVLAVAGTAQAKSEIELGLTALEYGATTTESDFDGTKSEDEETNLSTLDPDLRLNVYAPELMLGFGIDAGEDGTSGSLAAGYGVIKGKLYVGGLLNIENRKKKEETKPDVGASVETESTNELLVIGPYVEFRNKSGNALLSAGGALARLTSKSESETATGETSSEATVMAINLFGSYHMELIDRVWIGAGLDLTKSLSGEIEAKNGATSVDGDYDLFSYDLTLLDFLIEL